ncbi:MAG: alpha/beta fold hydrolase, partial [Thermoplasmatota archaeon]
SNSKYMIGNTARALAAGFNVVRMNMRSCGGTDEICPTIYHSGRSGDVAAVFRKIVEEQKLEAIALVGYSMGGAVAQLTWQRHPERVAGLDAAGRDVRLVARGGATKWTGGFETPRSA